MDNNKRSIADYTVWSPEGEEKECETKKNIQVSTGWKLPKFKFTKRYKPTDSESWMKQNTITTPPKKKRKPTYVIIKLLRTRDQENILKETR